MPRLFLLWLPSGENGTAQVLQLLGQGNRLRAKTHTDCFPLHRCIQFLSGVGP